MKKIFTFCVSLLAALSVFAYDFQSGDLFYNITSSSAPYTVEVTYQEYSLSYTGLTSVIIPETVTYEGTIYSVTSIGEGAFSGCSSLTSVTIPNSVTSIGERAFSSSSSLTSMIVENGNTIYDSRENCNAIIETATNTLIAGCQNTIIPNSVTSIGEAAFVYCSSLTSVTIPNSVTSISFEVFSGCDALTSIVVDSGNTTYDSRENCNAIIKTATNTLVAGCQSTIIPNSVTSIGDYAFGECEFLTSVTIPNNVTSIGKYAFYDCSSLDTIHVEATTPPALEDSTVFRNTPSPVCVIPCGTLAAYEASDWASQVGSFVEDCVEGQQIYYTSTDGNIVTPYKTDVFGANIVSNTYQDGKGVITFDGPVTSIGDYAFEYCSSLTSITIPNSVTSIGERAFSSSSSLTSMTVENGNTVYDSRENCNAIIETATNTLIAGCQNTIIPNSVTSIGNSAFEYCRSLTSITIPNSVTSIGDYAFYCCFSLTSITIPNSVTSIGERASYGCDKLTSITIPNSVTSIGEMAFASCDKLTSMVVESGNIIYDSRENCDAIIETATNTLIAGCKKTIIPNSVTSIGHNAFYWCTSLTSITIPNSVTSIGDYAFDYCFSLTSITIPNSVTSIGGRAFYGCDKLDTIHLEATTPPALGYSKVFTSSPICVIPCGTLAEYEISEWKNYVEAFVFDDTCDSKWCGDELYWKYGDGVLTIIGIGDMYDYASDTDVPWYDVHDKITSINISNGVSKIGNNAFTACISLNEIYVGATMPPILGDNALPSSSICLTPCGTLAVYEASDWANQVGSFEEFCPAVVKAKVPASWEDDDITVWVWTDGAGTEYPTTKDGDWYVYTHSVAEEFNIIFKSGTGWKGDTYQTVDINGIKKNTCLQIQSTSGKATYSIVDCEMKVDTTEYFITYTSTDGNIVTPNKTDVFGTNIISNTYVNGVGRLYFDGIVTSIGDSAFYNCETLSSITLPETVTLLGYGSFDDCTSLTKIRVKATTPPKMLGGYTFHNAPLDTCLIPCGTLDAYQSSDWASQVGEFVEVCPAVVKAKVPASWENDDITVWVWTDGAGTEYPTTKEGDWYVYTHTDTEEFNIIFKSGKGWKDERTKTVDIKGITENTCLEIQPTTGKATYTIVDCEMMVDTTEYFITYTSTDGNIITPNATDVFGANIVSNTYENGVGTITFDAPVTSIGNYAFYGCSSLTSVTIPNSVTSIGTIAFEDCTSLISITLPNSVTSIGDYAFYQCTSLTSITLPNSVTSIGDGAFEECTSLTSMTVENGNTVYDSRENCNAIIETATNTLIAGCQNTIIPNSVTSIGNNAFSGCFSLTSITIPNSVTSIGSHAFSRCSSLTSITIPNSVTSIGAFAFWGCFSLTSLIIPESVTSIADDAFSYCGAITSMVVENGNTIYDSRENCNAIIETATNTLIAGCQNTIIPNSVTSIGNNAFSGCSSLTSLTIPESVTSIAYYAFSGCSSLTSLTIPESVTSIAYYAFYGCSSLTSITIPNSVTSIGDGAFAYCSSLDTIHVEATTPPALADSTVFMNTPAPVCVIPCGTLAAYEASDWASQVGEFVEEGCAPIQMCGDDLYWEYADGVLTITGTGDMYDYAADTDVPWYDVRGNIKTVSLPDAMTKIGQNAFYKCTAMTTINMPTSLTAIGEKAFAQDTKLACEIILPASMTNIATRAFFNCKAVPAFHVEATTPPTVQADAFDYTTAPIHVPCGYGHIYGKHAQWGMLNLEMCELLQDNVYYYPIDGHTARAVTYHSNPTDTLVIPSAVVIDGVLRTVTEVADFAFTDCDNLPAIYFNEGLEYIGERAFVRCYGLKGTITLPTTLTTIGERAFSYCDNVEKYLLQAMTPPVLGEDVFTGNNKNALFYISCEAMDDYKVATNWSSLKSRLRDACLNIYHYNTDLGANGVYTTEDTLVASIYYRRQFTPYRWETLYLPFEVDRVTVLEDGVEYDLTAWDIVYGGHYFLAKPDGMPNKEILFGFTDELESHTPYIIQFPDTYYADKLITFYGKELWNKLSTSFEVLSSSAWMQIAGNTTLQDQLLEKPVYMLRSGLDFILQKTTTTLHPFECYVMPYTAQSGAPARMSVRLRDDVATAVESMKGNESRLAYTINGNTLTVYPQGQAFSIYSLNGALIYSCEAGKEAVDCELNSGCYLLHAGTEAHKIML